MLYVLCDIKYIGDSMNGMIYMVVVVVIHEMRRKNMKVTPDSVWELYSQVSNEKLLSRKDIDEVVNWWIANQKAMMN